MKTRWINWWHVIEMLAWIAFYLLAFSAGT